MSSIDDKVAALLAKQGLASAQPDTSKLRSEPENSQKTKTATGNGKETGKKTSNNKAVTKKSQAPSKAYENSLQFAHAYVRLQCNATAAYKELYPDVKDTTASTEGWKLLRKPEVQKILFPLLEALMEKNEVDTEFVIGRLLEQADASPLDYFSIKKDGSLGGFDLSAITPAQRRNLKSIKYKKTTFTDSEGEETVTEDFHVTVVDQQKAVEMFAKYLQMFTREMDEEDVARIGDMIEQGVKRIRKNKDLDAWKDGALEGTFSEVG